MPPAMNSRSLPFSVRLHREAVAVRPADGDLLARLHLVQPVGQAAALFDAELHILLVGGGGGDGEHAPRPRPAPRAWRIGRGYAQSSFLPSSPTTRKVLTSGVSMPDIRHNPDLGESTFRLSIIQSSLQRFDDFDNIHGDGAFGQGSARSPRSHTRRRYWPGNRPACA